MELFRIGFITFNLIDLIDIILVTVVFYRLYDIMRGTRGSQMFVGLLLILVVSFIVGAIGMKGMTWLVQSVSQVWVIAFVILFQPELRRLLIQIGQARIMRRLFRVQTTRVIDEITKAAVELSQKRYGGLFVIQRDMGLKAIIDSGVKLQAEATSELIVSIFYPRTPLHDGAIVINNNLIEAAACILPLTDNPNIDATLGTRHRAALGLSEETDAAVVVVSEETGQISLAHRGEFLARGMSGDELRDYLQQIFERVGSGYAEEL